MEMFCYQCEQTAGGKGCTVRGVCGKDPQTAALHDLLTYCLIGLSQLALAAGERKLDLSEVNRFVLEGLFASVTNVDFDAPRFVPLIQKAARLNQQLKDKMPGQSFGAAANFVPAADLEGMAAQARGVFTFAPNSNNPDRDSLMHTALFGLRGVAAYAHHAARLGKEDDRIYAFTYKLLAATQDDSLGVSDWVGLTLATGEASLWAMELLDAANTEAYGHPTPTAVPLGHKKGKAILVSGHDLQDLHTILELSKDKGIYVYTHGEMLPTHGYPKLKAYPHFYGHYGTAWQNQTREFSEFPGAILMTTNCIQRPALAYQDNIFTTDLVGFPGLKHVEQKDFNAVVEKALSLPGFTEDLDNGQVMVGFARNAVLGVADKVVEAVKSGKLRHFFLVAGCDGAKPGRNYYTEFVEKTPADTAVLTLACGKFRFFDKQLGDIGGIPRLLDIGQCNDAYSAVQIALALVKAFNLESVNQLPLSMVLSWYEQKAVAVLLALLFLGIKDIRLGPTLPAFVTPNVLQVLVENFNIMPISTPDADLKAILG